MYFPGGRGGILSDMGQNFFEVLLRKPDGTVAKIRIRPSQRN
jgi:hypothetical protein